MHISTMHVREDRGTMKEEDGWQQITDIIYERTEAVLRDWIDRLLKYADENGPKRLSLY